MNDFVLYALASLVFAFALVPLALFALGSRLPRAHELARDVRIGAAPDVVFALLADVERYPRWQKRVGHVALLAEEPRRRFRQRGRDGTLELEVEESVASSRFVLRTAPDGRAIFRGAWTFALEPEGDGTRVTLTERGEVASPIARLFARYVLPTGANVERTLHELRAACPSPG